MRQPGTLRRATWCWVVATSCVGALVACGSDDRADDAGSRATPTERESFAFELFDTSEASGDVEEVVLEGVVDPASGSGSATFVDDLDEEPVTAIVVNGVGYLSNPRPRLDPDLERYDVPGSGPCAGRSWMLDDMPTHLPTILQGDPILQIDLDRVHSLIASGQPAATVVDEHNGATTFALSLPDDIATAPAKGDEVGPVTVADLSATLDVEGQIIEVEWVTRYDAEAVTTTRIEMFDFGVPVEVTAPADDDVCSYSESLEHS